MSILKALLALPLVNACYWWDDTVCYAETATATVTVDQMQWYAGCQAREYIQSWGIFADNGGQPGAAIAYADQATYDSSASYANLVQLTSSVNVVAGETYWACAVSAAASNPQSPLYSFDESIGTTGLALDTATNFGSLPDLSGQAFRTVSWRTSWDWFIPPNPCENVVCPGESQCRPRPDGNGNPTTCVFFGPLAPWAGELEDCGDTGRHCNYNANCVEGQCVCNTAAGFTGDGIDCTRSCGNNDVYFYEGNSVSSYEGGYLLNFEYDEANFLQDGEVFNSLTITAGSCQFAVGTPRDGCAVGSTSAGSNDPIYSVGSTWASTPAAGEPTCNNVVLATTLNNLQENCGFTVGGEGEGWQENVSTADLTVLRGLVTYHTSTTKVVRGVEQHRCYERSTQLAITMGTTVSVTTNDVAVFGFAINEFAVTDSAFDPTIRNEDGANDTDGIGEDLTTTFVTSVQWPYVLRSSDFTINGLGGWEQQTTSATASPGTAINGIDRNGAFTARTNHEVGYALEVGNRALDCPEVAGTVCTQTWEVIVARTDFCSSLTPLELDANYNANFDVGCRGAFTGACVDASGNGEDQAQAGQERFVTGFETNGNAAGQAVDGAGGIDVDAANTVSWSSDSDNYCTRVLDEIPLEGTVAVYDSEDYDQTQDQFTFGSTAYVKVEVHARAELAHVIVEKIELNHQRGLDNDGNPGPSSTQYLYYDGITDNADFEVNGADEAGNSFHVTFDVNVPGTAPEFNVNQTDSLLHVVNDELTRFDDPTKGANEQLNEGVAHFDFQWNEHTSPAGSAGEDAATVTSIVVDVRVQFQAAAPRRMRMLLQAPAFANPATRQEAIVGVSRGTPTEEVPNVGASATTTASVFTALALGVCAAQ